MRRDALKLGRRTRLAFYGAFAALFASGAGWLMLDAIGSTDTEFGPQPHPAGPWLLRVHGAAAMLVLLVLGAMLPLHLQRGWRARLNRRTGTTIAVLCGLLIVTGYLLYYSGGDTVRRLAVWFHNALGFAFPLILLWHIRRGRALRRRAAP